MIIQLAKTKCTVLCTIRLRTQSSRNLYDTPNKLISGERTNCNSQLKRPISEFRKNGHL